MSNLIDLSGPSPDGHPIQGRRSARQGASQVIRSEMIKLRSLRSTKWTLLTVVV
jgi:hypothetical protein